MGGLTKKKKEESGLEVFFLTKRKDREGEWPEGFSDAGRKLFSALNIWSVGECTCSGCNHPFNNIFFNVLDFAKNISQFSFLNCKMNNAGKVFIANITCIYMYTNTIDRIMKKSPLVLIALFKSKISKNLLCK